MLPVEPVRHDALPEPHPDLHAQPHAEPKWRREPGHRWWRRFDTHADPSANADPNANPTSGGTGAGGTSAVRTQTPVDPTPFASLANAVSAVTTGQGLDAARIPPVEALTPLSGLDFGNGLNLGPILLLVDLIGIGMLIYLVRIRWLAHEA